MGHVHGWQPKPHLLCYDEREQWGVGLPFARNKVLYKLRRVLVELVIVRRRQRKNKIVHSIPGSEQQWDPMPLFAGITELFELQRVVVGLDCVLCQHTVAFFKC